jgi:hypothetical protein
VRHRQKPELQQQAVQHRPATLKGHPKGCANWAWKQTSWAFIHPSMESVSPLPVNTTPRGARTVRRTPLAIPSYGVEIRFKQGFGLIPIYSSALRCTKATGIPGHGKALVSIKPWRLCGGANQTSTSDEIVPENESDQGHHGEESGLVKPLLNP